MNIIVTGGSRGIGEAIVRRLAKDGHAINFLYKEQIEKAQVVFDVVALPVETPLLKAAKQASKITISGADVAVIQSLEQFVLYTGVRPPLGTIVEARDYTHRAISGM